MYNVLESYESPKWSFYDYPEDHFLQVLNKTNEIIYKINELANTLNNKINSLEELLTELGINMYNQGFSEAQTCLKTWNNQAITLQKVNTTDFRKYVKTILVESQDGLPYHFASAFSSAVKRTELINNSTNSSTNNIKTHFCMFFSDMVFLKNMYDFEFFYLPIVYTGTALKTYRADRAKEYLDYVSFIKDSILENYNKHTTAEEKNYLYDVYSFIVAWEIQLLAHYELVYGPIDTTKPQVEPASNYKLGFGTFGNKNADLKLGYALQKYSYILKKDNDYPIVAYQDLTDGMDLTGFCDPNNSSNFELGKYFKLVVNEKNILDSSLNLTPVYKDLSMNSYPPSSGKCYIDTINGKFILPRPIYWSKMENLAINLEKWYSGK
ncbi:MAG: hypothetical protein GYA51_04155 [Candidatus Methanofastidiosa archaeon]|nr:hypothetical protein [Candidatus Methanofastidiosa archaeon]